MRTYGRFTGSDWAGVLGSVALAVVVLGAVGESGRERAKQAVCLANLKQLTSAWLSYAEANDGKLVNGAAGIDRISSDKRETAWVGRCWASNYSAGGQMAVAQQWFNIRMGALWPHVRETRLYRCPGGHPGQMLSYAIVDAANGMHRTGTYGGWGNYINDTGARVDDTVVWLKRLSEIISPPASERMVFIDDGMATPDSFGVHYRYEMWWDDPPGRHGDGTSVSFADGHCEDWRWRGEETILNGRARRMGQFNVNYKLPTPEDKDDLHRLQIAVWGRLGY